MNLQFLQEITFVRVLLEFTPQSKTVELPPFSGSALRGAFGHAFRKRLCYCKSAGSSVEMPADNPCQRSGECTMPDQCEYFRLFERSRNGSSGTGANVIKPYILNPPVPSELELIASGAPVRAPFFETTHAIHNQTPLAVPTGFSVGFTLLGQAAALLDPVVELLSLSPLEIGSSRFVLGRVTDTASLGANDNILWQRDSRLVRRPVIEQRLATAHAVGHEKLRLSLITPCRLRASSSDGGAYRFNGDEFATLFWQAALVRAVRVRDSFCASAADRLPWQELPSILPTVVRTRLFRYHYERLSNRQQKKMDFDGFVGAIWYSGELLDEWAPLVSAAEVLHVGQKATFGLGRVKASWE